MKRLLLLLLAFVLLLTMIGCAKGATQPVDLSDTDTLTIEEDLSMLGTYYSDFFIGTVLSVKKESKIECENISCVNNYGYSYEIEINNEIWSSTVKKGEIIRAVSYDIGYALEKGKSYLISGYTQISNIGTALLVRELYTYLLQEDGSMQRVSENPKGENVFKSVEQLKNTEEMKHLIESGITNLPPCFYMEWVEETPIRVTDGDRVLIEKGEKQHPREEVLGYVREAVKKDSKVKIEDVSDDAE